MQPTPALGLLLSAKRLLVLAAGGGNDAVSSLWALAQLRRMGLAAVDIDIACMLPTCVDYQGLKPACVPGVGILTASVTRQAAGRHIGHLPERILVQHCTEFGLRTIYGMLVTGSLALAQSISTLQQHWQYDCILCLDVGGDMITLDSNPDLLSPYMDGVAVAAMQQLQPSLPIVGMVIGAGMDGETKPERLRLALSLLSPMQGVLEPIAAKETAFYLQKVAPIRNSRTGTLLAGWHQTGDIPVRAEYQRTFHIPNGRSFTRRFTRVIDPQLARHFYIFGDFRRIVNRYSVATCSARDWIEKTQTCKAKTCHELVGQTVAGWYVATPPHFFRGGLRETVLQEIVSWLHTVSCPFYMYRDDSVGRDLPARDCRLLA